MEKHFFLLTSVHVQRSGIQSQAPGLTIKVNNHLKNLDLRSELFDCHGHCICSLQLNLHGLLEVQ